MTLMSDLQKCQNNIQLTNHFCQEVIDKQRMAWMKIEDNKVCKYIFTIE